MDELVARAVELEHQGEQFYLSMAKTASDELTRALFENLAKDERAHADVVRSLAADAGLPQVAATTTSAPMEQRVREVFEALELPPPAPGPEVMRGLQLAMDMEQEAIDLYRQLLDEDLAPAQKGFVEQLLQQEWQHLEALRNVHFYLGRPGEWHDQEESQRWNWMNI